MWFNWRFRCRCEAVDRRGYDKLTVIHAYQGQFCQDTFGEWKGIARKSLVSQFLAQTINAQSAHCRIRCVMEVLIKTDSVVQRKQVVILNHQKLHRGVINVTPNRGRTK